MQKKSFMKNSVNFFGNFVKNLNLFYSSGLGF